MTLTSASTLFQEASKNAPRKPRKINGRIAPIRPFKKVKLSRRVRSQNTAPLSNSPPAQWHSNLGPNEYLFHSEGLDLFPFCFTGLFGHEEATVCKFTVVELFETVQKGQRREKPSQR